MGFCNYLCKLSPFVGNLLIYSRTKNVVLIALNTIRRLKTCQMVGLTSNFDKIFRGFNYSAGDAAPTNEIRLSLLKEKRCESRYNICSIKYHSGNKIPLLATCHIFTSRQRSCIIPKFRLRGRPARWQCLPYLSYTIDSASRRIPMM